MTYEVIIATYNRPHKASSLSKELLSCMFPPKSVIIVDSSEYNNRHHFENPLIQYIRSSHKNQPYQRFLGFSCANAEFLLFLDDDMEIVDKNFAAKVAGYFDDPEVTGLALNFRDKYPVSSLSGVPASSFGNKGRLMKFLHALTGYPDQPPGKFSWNGLRGSQPGGGGQTEWVSGGAFMVRRKSCYFNFNFQLFDLFENRTGMGEDAILGYSLSRVGRVHFVADLFFLHNDQKDSNYSVNLLQYSSRVAFSRYYLSLEYARLTGKSLWKGKIIAHYYLFWRTLMLFINWALHPEKKRYRLFKGTIKGWILTATLRFGPMENFENKWKKTVTHELHNQI